MVLIISIVIVNPTTHVSFVSTRDNDESVAGITPEMTTHLYAFYF